MTHRTRTGLVAAGVVAGTALAVGVIVYAASKPAGRLATVASGDDRALAREIAGHPFWRAKLSADGVLAMAGKIRAAPRDSVVYIDDGARLEIRGAMPDEWKLEMAMRKPKRLSGRCAIISTGQLFATRPSLGQVLRAIKDAVAAEEYRS
jgi:hypothetical protein